MPHKDELRDEARRNGTYDIYIEIDIDCQELLDAIDMEYTLCRDDDTQNEIALHLDEHEWSTGIADDVDFANTDEQGIAAYLLNPELGEYTTKVTIYKPSGDVVIFK
mgnify:CR=1 FL=1|jgi:hypothetical protein